MKLLICHNCGSGLDREDFCFECYLRKSCEDSGVPRHLEDPETIEKIATLLAPR